MYFVYLPESGKVARQRYVGRTSDLRRRLAPPTPSPNLAHRFTSPPPPCFVIHAASAGFTRRAISSPRSPSTTAISY